MKKNLFVFFVIPFVLMGCDLLFAPPLEKNGLTADINELVPQSIIDEMESIGMPIFTGNRPPNLGLSTGKSYKASPFILKSSNRSGDTPGYTFADYYVNFHEQNNSDLTVKINYENGGEEGSGLGAFIVGKDSEFTVFAEVNSTYMSYSAKMVHVISGTVTTTGIKDLYFANFMVDNYGNVGKVWIENEEGRVIYDSDGISEIADYSLESSKVKSLKPSTNNAGIVTSGTVQ